MPSKLILIREEERIPLYFGEKGAPDTAVIYYRRLPARKRREIIEAHTAMGVTNFYKAALDFVRYAIVGWEGIIDPSGTTITYHPDLIDFLPEEAITEITNRLSENAPTSFFSS